MKESFPGTPKFILDKEFYSRFHDEDQRLMKSGEWDYLDMATKLNSLKQSVEATSDQSLTEDQLSDKNNALWLWYHHASQFAYGKHKDIPTALAFINKALIYRDKIGLDNQITPLLKLLYIGDLENAKTFADTIPKVVIEVDENGEEMEVENPERESALALLEHFEKEKLAK